MTGRDRMVLIAVVVLVALGAAWLLVVSPERKQASELGTQVATAQTQLASAESEVSSARAAQSQYAAAYAALVSLGKAVPPSQEVPALIDQIAQASNRKSINFTSITATASAGLSELTNAVELRHRDGGPHPASVLVRLRRQLFRPRTPVQPAHQLRDAHQVRPARGQRPPADHPERQSVPRRRGAAAEPGKGNGKLTGSITATAYVMPASQAPSPAGATTPTGTSPASSTSSSVPSPAIVKVNP